MTSAAEPKPVRRATSRDALLRLGVTRVINAAGTVSRFGGATLEAEVAQAMAEAAQISVDMWALQALASERLAAASGAEAGLVTTGASAALTLAAAAILAGGDVARMARLPETGDAPAEILMPRTHRNAYDRALTLAGARIRDIGVDDVGTGAGLRGLEAWEVETAITPRTAAIACLATPQTERDVMLLCEVGRRCRLPVIVDAAAQLPPRENLRKFIRMGASLVAVSGGKALRGPAGTGLLLGLRPLIASAALQMLDMDVRPETFRAPQAFFPNGVPRALPRHGIGRGFKASKEAIIGLLVALERFVEAEPGQTAKALQARVQAIAVALAGITGLGLRREPATDLERAPRLVLAIDPSKAGIDALGVASRLADHAPPVMLGEGRILDNLLLLDLSTVAPADDDQLVWSIRTALKRSDGGA